ncbi:hypothetical protein CesoFtcFv8_026460 [Champsocephalus esox]|uniref:Uncharacterized protein n=1 Tax=Champsocephalus esox TaxID=159716 RepID=A0AAN8GDQ8_9TELE|nr:hypothetical protein CesoFtcFv8_026460 [Champsocephalus esox]
MEGRGGWRGGKGQRERRKAGGDGGWGRKDGKGKINKGRGKEEESFSLILHLEDTRFENRLVGDGREAWVGQMQVKLGGGGGGVEYVGWWCYGGSQPGMGPAGGRRGGDGGEGALREVEVGGGGG